MSSVTSTKNVCNVGRRGKSKYDVSVTEKILMVSEYFELYARGSIHYLTYSTDIGSCYDTKLNLQTGT